MKTYTKTDHFDNPKNSQYRTQARWTPGDPLPKNQRPDAHAALARNADAYDKYLHDEQRRRVADRRAA